MNKTIFIISIFAITLSLTLYAQTGGHHPGNGISDIHSMSCSEANLSSEQEVQIHHAFQELHASIGDLYSQTHTAHQNYVDKVLDRDSGQKEAKVVASNMLESQAEIQAANVAFTTMALYEIAEPEQRDALLKCLGHLFHDPHAGHGEIHDAHLSK